MPVRKTVEDALIRRANEEFEAVKPIRLGTGSLIMYGAGVILYASFMFFMGSMYGSLVVSGDSDFAESICGAKVETD